MLMAKKGLEGLLSRHMKVQLHSSTSVYTKRDPHHLLPWLPTGNALKWKRRKNASTKQAENSERVINSLYFQKSSSLVPAS